MWKDAYLESRVLAADPLELVQMVYRHATESVQQARRSLAAGNIAARSKAICDAISAVCELDGSLDHSVEGTMSQRLAELYRYMRTRLTEANLRQQDEPLAEVEALLATLAEAWQGTAASPERERQSANRFVEPPAIAVQELECRSAHMWSA